MNKFLKPLLINIIWLIVAILLGVFASNLLIGNTAVDIQMHDSYGLLDVKVLTMPTAVLAIFIVKELFRKGTNKISLIIMLCTVIYFSYVFFSFYYALLKPQAL